MNTWGLYCALLKGGKMNLIDVIELQGTVVVADGVELPASSASDGC